MLQVISDPYCPMSGSVRDYVHMYPSVCPQHGLCYIQLSRYAAKVAEPCCLPILYTKTIPNVQIGYNNVRRVYFCNNLITVAVLIFVPTSSTNILLVAITFTFYLLTIEPTHLLRSYYS